MRTLVVGAGAMGRWLADALDGDVAFADTDPDAARAAAAAADAAVAPIDDEDSFDMVCLAVPIPAVGDVVAAQGDRADRAMVDVTGEMATPLAAMSDHASDVERVSLHPLFAPSNAPGSIAVVSDAPGPVTDELLATLVDAGNDLFETTAEEHDEAMETVQASAHAAVLAYALAAESVDDRFHTPVSAGLQSLVDTVTAGDQRVYADIQSRFDGAEGVAEAAAALAAADADEFAALFERAGGRSQDGTTDDTDPTADATDGRTDATDDDINSHGEN